MKGLTAAYRLANTAVGGLEAWVAERRQAGQSWRRISIELLQEHDIDVSPETLRGWLKQAAADEDAA